MSGRTFAQMLIYVTIINDNARIINKLDASLTEDARVIIYDHHMFIVQATGCKIVAVQILILFLVRSHNLAWS